MLRGDTPSLIFAMGLGSLQSGRESPGQCLDVWFPEHPDGRARHAVQLEAIRHVPPEIVGILLESFLRLEVRDGPVIAAGNVVPVCPYVEFIDIENPETVRHLALEVRRELNQTPLWDGLGTPDPESDSVDKIGQLVSGGLFR